MSNYTYITLREKPELIDTAAGWFHEKWYIPKEAYQACMVQGDGEPEMSRFYIKR